MSSILSPSGIPRAGRARGSSMLEVVIAISVFLVVSAGLATASVRLASQAARNEVRISTVGAVDSRLEQLSGAPFDQLVADTYVAPDACGSSGTPQGRQSCVTISGRSMTIDYRTSVGRDLVAGAGTSGAYVELTASASLPDGSVISRSRKVPAPSAGYTADGAVLRVRAAEPAVDLPPLTVLDAQGVVVADGVPFSSGTAVVRVDGAACAGTNAPCRVALSSDAQSWFRTGDWTLAPWSIGGTGGQVTLTPGTLTETVVDVTKVGSARIRVLAQPVDGAPVAGAPAGSVCVWATFDDGSGTRQVPYCNSGAGSNNGEFIVIDQWPGIAGGAYPFTAGTTLRVGVGAPGAACPTTPTWDGTVIQGATANNALVASDVCTSHTWGYPTVGGLATDNPVALPGGELSVTAGVDAPVYSLIWTAEDSARNPVALPASGGGNVPVWSKPRSVTSAGSCATDDNPATPCVAPVYTPVPERAVGAPGACAANPYCLSAWNLAPVLTNPAGPYAIETDDAVENLITFAAVDPDGTTVSLRIDTLPTSGTLTDRLGTAVTAGTTLAAANSWDLRYVCTVCDGPVATMDITLLDAGGASRSHQIGLYGVARPWTITGPASLTLAQAQAPTAVRVQVTDTTGAVVANVTPQLTATGLTASALSPTDAEGFSSFTLAAGTAVPGSYNAQVTVEGRTLTIPVTVTATAGAVAITNAVGGAQGSSGTVTTTVRDVNDAPIANRAIDVSVAIAGTPTTKVRPQLGSCVTDGSGSCTTGLQIDQGAAAGTYQVTATSGSATTSSTVTVTAAVSSLSAAGATGTDDRYATSTTSAGPVRWFRLDERAGSSAASASGGPSGTWSGGPTLGATALVAGGASAAAVTDGDDDRMCAAGAGGTGSVTFEVWTRFSGLTNTSSNPATVFGNPTGGAEIQMVLGGDGPAGQEQPGTLRLLVGSGVNRTIVNGTVTELVDGTVETVYTPVPLVPGRLYHLTGVLDTDGGEARLYVDGRLVDRRAVVAAPTGDDTWCLGGSPGGPHVAGTFDEAAIFDRVLSDAQIAARYALGSATASGGGWVTAAQGTSVSVPVQVRDGAGDPIAGQVVTASSDRSGVTVTTPSVTTGVTGEATVTVAVAGDADAGPGVGRLLVSAGSAAVPVLVEVSAVPATLEVAPVTVVAGGRTIWQVTVTDRSGAVVPGWSVTAAATDPPAGLRLSGRATTDAGGRAVFQVGARPGTPEDVTEVTFTAAGVSASSEVTITEAGTRVQPLDGPVRVTQGGSAAVRLLVLDANGERLPDATVSLGCSGCGLGFTGATSDTNGIAAVSVVDTGGWNPAGSYPVVVSVNGEPRVVEATVKGRVADVGAPATVVVGAGAETPFRVKAWSDPLVSATGATPRLDTGFEQAGVGTQLTNFADSGFWRVQGAGAEATITASDAQAVTGTRSAHVSGSHPTVNRALLANLACPEPTGGACSAALPTTSYTSTFLYVPTPSTGGTAPIVLQLMNSTYNTLGQVQYKNDRTGLVVVGGTATAEVGWVTNEWMRLDHEYDSVTRTQRLRVFWGDALYDRNPGNASADSGDVAAGTTGAALPAYMSLGAWANRPATNHYLDDVTVHTTAPYDVGDPEAVAGVPVAGSGPSGITVRGAVTGADGIATLSVRVPQGVAPGTYTVTLSVAGEQVGQVDVEVTP